MIMYVIILSNQINTHIYHRSDQLKIKIENVKQPQVLYMAKTELELKLC